jgi:hypothetical protein
MQLNVFTICRATINIKEKSTRLRTSEATDKRKAEKGPIAR